MLVIISTSQAQITGWSYLINNFIDLISVKGNHPGYNVPFTVLGFAVKDENNTSMGIGLTTGAASEGTKVESLAMPNDIEFTDTVIAL